MSATLMETSIFSTKYDFFVVLHPPVASMFIYCIHRSGQQYSKVHNTVSCIVFLIKMPALPTNLQDDKRNVNNLTNNLLLLGNGKGKVIPLQGLVLPRGWVEV